MFGELDDYHPPTDIRGGECFLSQISEAVRSSPAWEQTALLIVFDEYGGCFDHVPPPAAPIPDDSPGEQGFGFDRFGVRAPAIVVSPYVVSPYTERGTVIADDSHDLGPADAARALRSRPGANRATGRRPRSTWPSTAPSRATTAPR